MSKLTLKQQRFVDEYLVTLNAAQSAISAGYSEKTAYAQGSQLLKNPEVQKALYAAIHKRNDRVVVSQDRILEELAKMAFATPDDIAEWNGNGLSFKQSDKMKAIELLMRHTCMMNDKLDMGGNLEIRIVETEGYCND